VDKSVFLLRSGEEIRLQANDQILHMLAFPKTEKKILPKILFGTLISQKAESQEGPPKELFRRFLILEN